MINQKNSKPNVDFEKNMTFIKAQKISFINDGGESINGIQVLIAEITPKSEIEDNHTDAIVTKSWIQNGDDLWTDHISKLSFNNPIIAQFKLNNMKPKLVDVFFDKESGLND